MTMGELYLVVGASGEYGDYHTWNVRGFAVRSVAEAFKAELDAAALAFREALAKCAGFFTEPQTLTYEQYDRRAKKAVRAMALADPAVDNESYRDVVYRIEALPFVVADADRREG